MQRFKEHIGFKIVTLFLALTLLTPTVVKLVHVFYHNYEVCNEHKAHVHGSEIDCSFHKFKLASSFTIPTFSVQLFIPEHNHEYTTAQYSFLSEYQQLHFSLRGPPVSI